MNLTLQALSVTMTFDEPVEREDDLTALPVFPFRLASGALAGHSSVIAINYSDDDHTVTLTFDVADVALAGPDESTPPTT